MHTVSRRLKAFRWMVYPLLGYLAFCVYMYASQDRMLYHPVSISRADAQKQLERLYPRARMLDDKSALVFEDDRPVIATAILFHGNGGHALHRHRIYDAFAARGIRLIVAEYPGYGWRDGSPTEKLLVDEGLALYESVRNEMPQDHPVMIVGESLGSGVAVQVAARSTRPPARLVLLTPFTSVADVAAGIFWMLPVRLLLRDSYDSMAHIGLYRGPVSILVTENDEIVGSDSGLALHRAADRRGMTSLVFLRNAGHNGWWHLMSGADWDSLLVAAPVSRQFIGLAED